MHTTTSTSLAQAMPNKARIPGPRDYSLERPTASTTKQKRIKKSQSKEKKVAGQNERLRNSQVRAHDSYLDNSQDFKLSGKQSNSTVENNNNNDLQGSQSEVIGSFRRNTLSNKKNQTQLVTPSQRPIFKLLQAYKLQQYTRSFIDLGYGEDVYKLALISQRKKQELFDQIDFLPGHKQRLVDLFKLINNLYPKQNVAQTLDSAMRTSNIRQSQARLSGGCNTINETNQNTNPLKKSQNSNQTMILQGGVSRESVTSEKSLGLKPLNTHPITVQQLIAPQQVLKRGIQGKSPTDKKRGGMQCSLTRRFNALDAGTRATVNENFLINIRAGKVQAATVSEALREFYGQNTATKLKIINKIFLTNKNGGIKPHTLLQQNTQNLNTQNGFAPSKIVSLQKGSHLIEYRSTNSSSTKKTRTENQHNRRIEKRSKNSNSSSESRKLGKTNMIKQSNKGKKSNSSERREGGIQLGPVTRVPNTRLQLQQQDMLQSVQSQSRMTMNQNQNFAIAPGRINESSKTAAQIAAMDRIKLHRQKSAQKQIRMQNAKTTIWSSSDDRNSTRTGTNDAKMANSKPQNGSSAYGIPPPFVMQQQSSKQAQYNIARTSSMRRRASRDRAENEFAAHNSTQKSFLKDNRGLMIGGTAKDYNNSRLNSLKRASSQGAGQRNTVVHTQASIRRSEKEECTRKDTGVDSGSFGAQVTQSAAFTEFKIVKSPQDYGSQQQSSFLPAIEPKSISSTMKKLANTKTQAVVEQSDYKPNGSSMEALQPAAIGFTKPPISSSKRSRRSEIGSKFTSSVHSDLDVGTPADKTSQNALKGLQQSVSTPHPVLLEPIKEKNTVNLTVAADPGTRITPSTNVEDLKDSHEEKLQTLAKKSEEVPSETEKDHKNNPEECREQIKDNWSPLLASEEKNDALLYGYSFGSKKVAMGPGFINLRFMCHCLARAIKRHLDFSKGKHWFLQDLQAEADDIDLEFSYQLPPDLKLTLNPNGIRVRDSDDEDDANPFQREDQQSPARDIDNMDIEVNATAKSKSELVTKFAPEKNRQKPGQALAEPEPESIKSSEDGSGSARLSSFKLQSQQAKPFSNNKANPIPDEISEDLDAENDLDNPDQAYADNAEHDPEEQSIKDLRREQLRKSVLEKDERSLTEILKEHKLSELEHKLKSKDRQIAQLTRLVTNGFAGKQEVLAIAPVNGEEVNTRNDEETDGIRFFDRDAKMDRAEWLMAQVDLDPIESHGSDEMSTTKFKSLHGKRFVNSEVKGGYALEDSKQSRRTEIHPTLEKRQKKKSVKSYESAFIDVSEDKMREFVLSQLRYFDSRMQYDELDFQEDQHVPMPTEKYIAEYCKYVTIACKMENEIPIVCLVYLEKLLLTTGILLNKWNWRRIVLICLCLASKIWDDDSLENVHFPKVLGDVTNAEINKLEQLFLEFIDYKLVIKGSEYAKYYFILRSLAEDINNEKALNGTQYAISPFENEKRNKNNSDEWGEFPLRAPISAVKMIELQRQEAKAEVYLKERHEREFLQAYIGNKAGSRKDKERHPSLLLDRSI